MFVEGSSMSGKTVLITGATSGIGKATAMGLAGLGANLVLVSRDGAKLERTADEIAQRTRNTGVEWSVCELSSLQDVRRTAMEIKRKHPRLDVLINNAGTIVGKRKITVDGYEYTFALDHLSPFLLTNLLLDTLKASAPARIITVSSSAHLMGHIHFDDLMLAEGFTPFKAYSQAKLANVLFTYALARRLQGTGVTANCLHPGVVRTNFGKELGGAFRLGMAIARTFQIGPETGAKTSIFLASSSSVEGVSGKFFVRSREARSSKESYDQMEADRLWEMSLALTGLAAPVP
jgi:retinol dehydrogenase 14